MEKDYKYEIIEHDIPISLIKNNQHSLKKINKKYMITLNNNTIYIYDFEKKNFLNKSIHLNECIYYFDFNSNTENIFYICSGKNVILYQIVNMDINKICIIEGHFIEVIYGFFNPFDRNIFISISENGFIKIYDITNSSPIGLINLTESLENIFVFKLGKNTIGFGLEDHITYFSYINYKNENVKKYFSEDIIDFYFLNDYDDSLLIIKKDKIEIVKNNIKIIEHKIKIKTSFYLVKKKILLIINSKIQGLKINDNNEIINLFDFSQDLYYFISHPIFVNENHLKGNEICEMYEPQFKGKIFSFLTINDNITEENSIEQNDNKINIENIKKNISDIPLIISKDNNEPFNSSYNPRDKKYFGIESIKHELIAVKKRSFLDRKEKVMKNIEQIKNISDIKQKYISLLSLIINDNTNIELLKEYLDFINKNKDELKNIFKGYFEDFQNELNYFSKAFIIEENIFNLKTKIKSQKEEFYDFLESLSKLDKDNENDINKFENYIIGYDEYFKNISYFNMPIDFSNEQLFYYRNINVIKYYLKNEYDKIKDKIKSEIDKIKDNNNAKIEQIKKYKKIFLKNEIDKLSSNIKLCIHDL